MALRRLLAGAAVVALMTPPALAQDAQQPQAQAEQMVAQEDRDFATEAAQETYHELQQLSGTEFDEAYLDEMVSDHEDDIATFEDYVENGQDPDLRRFAEETLPTLQQHLDLARQTKEQVAAAGEQEQPDLAMAADGGSSVVNQRGEEVGTITSSSRTMLTTLCCRSAAFSASVRRTSQFRSTS